MSVSEGGCCRSRPRSGAAGQRRLPGRVDADDTIFTSPTEFVTAFRQKVAYLELALNDEGVAEILRSLIRRIMHLI